MNSSTLPQPPLAVPSSPSPLPRNNRTVNPSRSSHSHSIRTPSDGGGGVSWSSTVARHARRGLLSDAASAFSLMLSSSDAVPNHITLLTLLSACADFASSSAAALPLGLSLHAHIVKCYPLSASPSDRVLLQLNTALLDFYAKCGCTRHARQVFDRMPLRNSFTFNAMIAGHMRAGEVEPAVYVFHHMPPNVRDKVSWTALIDGFVKNGHHEKALRHFRAMQRQEEGRIEPDYVMILAVVAACAELSALVQGMWVHRYAMSRGRDLCGNVRLTNSLIDMYSRCGRVDLAHQVFDRVDSCTRTRVTWNSMIVGFAINGCCLEALDLFDQMQGTGIKPDGVSFTGALTACTHGGLVDEGLKYYKLMQQEHCDVPMRIEHYGCLVDLLGRAGRLEEAMNMVESMALTVGVNEVLLGSLLAACRMHKNVDLADKLMAYLVQAEPETDSNFVLLSNIYAAAGRWDGVGKVRNLMKSLGIKKSPGFSAVEVDGVLHEFVSGDRGHIHSEDIYCLLELLKSEMKPHHLH